MKSLILAITMIFSMSCFAATSSSALADRLGASWRNYHKSEVVRNKNDITMVYGGEDLALNPALSHTTTST